MKLLAKLSLWMAPLAIVVALSPVVAARQGNVKTVYATILDEKDKPILDFKADELGVFEDGKVRPAVSAAIATSPVSIVMLADTSKVVGSGGLSARGASTAGELIRDIRAAFTAFSKKILAANPQSELALMQFGQAAVMVQPFTNKADDLDKAINHLIPQPDADSVLLEAITDSAKELGKRPNMRRFIVSINVEPGNEASREPPNNIMRELLKSHASYYAVSLQAGENKNQLRGAAMPTLVKETGGHRDFIVGQSALVGMLEGYADMMLGQYEIKFQRPDGPPPSGAVLGTLRQGKFQFLMTKQPAQ